MTEGIAISWTGLNVVVVIVTSGGGVVVAAFWWIYRRLADQSKEMSDIRLDMARNYVQLPMLAHVTQRLDSTEVKVAQVADAVDHLPDKESTHRLELCLEAMRGELRVLAEQIKPVSAISSRMQEMMMERPSR